LMVASSNPVSGTQFKWPIVARMGPFSSHI